MTAKETAQDGVLNVGIDLGTSRSSISTSDGQKHVIESYVGWPTDMVAKKVLKKRILIGVEALKNRVMLDLHRPLERGLIKEGSEKDLQAVRELLTHLLAKAGIKGTSGGTVRAVVGVPAEAMRVNKQQLRHAMAGVVDSLMIVSEPFAVAYGLDALLHALIIDVGAGTTDFCVMNGRYPTEEDQRTLTTAGDSVDEQLEKLIAKVEPEYQAEVRNRVFLSGGSSLIRGLANAIERALDEFGGGKVTVVEDPVYVGADGGLAIATDAPESDWETLSA